jgi:hypothetical protein
MQMQGKSKKFYPWGKNMDKKSLSHIFLKFVPTSMACPCRIPLAVPLQRKNKCLTKRKLHKSVKAPRKDNNGLSRRNRQIMYVQTFTRLKFTKM